MNLTVLLSIAIPSALMMLNLWSGYALRAEMNAKFERMEARFERIETRIDRLDEKVDRRYSELDRRIEGVRTEMSQLRDSIHRDMLTLHERVAVAESQAR